jgi:hypothetical protein
MGNEDRSVKRVVRYQGEVTPDGVESVEVRWFDLSDPSQLSLEVLNSDTAFTTVQRIRQVLGYT